MQLAAINITAQIVLNNLVQVDELSQLVTIDLKFRLYWFDNRFNITPALFKALHPSYSVNVVLMSGINITT